MQRALRPVLSGASRTCMWTAAAAGASGFSAGAALKPTERLPRVSAIYAMDLE